MKMTSRVSAAAADKRVDANAGMIAAPVPTDGKPRKNQAGLTPRELEQYRELSKKDPEYLNALWLDEMTRLYARMRENGRVELLDHFLHDGGLTITEFPLPRKK